MLLIIKSIRNVNSLNSRLLKIAHLLSTLLFISPITTLYLINQPTFLFQLFLLRFLQLFTLMQRSYLPTQILYLFTLASTQMSFVQIVARKIKSMHFFGGSHRRSVLFERRLGYWFGKSLN